MSVLRERAVWIASLASVLALVGCLFPSLDEISAKGASDPTNPNGGAKPGETAGVNDGGGAASGDSTTAEPSTPNPDASSTTSGGPSPEVFCGNATTKCATNDSFCCVSADGIAAPSTFSCEKSGSTKKCERGIMHCDSKKDCAGTGGECCVVLAGFGRYELQCRSECDVGESVACDPNDSTTKCPDDMKCTGEWMYGGSQFKTTFCQF